MENLVKTPILLVGAGPIGVEMAIALKKNHLEYIHIEAECLGATINWYAPGTSFFSSPERLS
jgi:thioredoxin reductase (NADPH)